MIKSPPSASPLQQPSIAVRDQNMDGGRRKIATLVWILATTAVLYLVLVTRSDPGSRFSGGSVPQAILEYSSLPSSDSGSATLFEETAPNGRKQHQTGKSKKVLNLHVVPHSHDDPGWKKTVDQYYYGWNNTIQNVCVRDIFTSVVEALEENPSRTFVYAEAKFFAMWWREQPESARERVRKLVKETKQFSFVNGGWCMHDEASTHYIGMIDQTTLGHGFLKETLDYVPTVGWQLDPFGHSATQSSLMTYKVGFDALYFGRIDYQDLELRQTTKECEGLWNTYGGTGSGLGDGTNKDTGGQGRAGNTNEGEGSIFWGLSGSYKGNYGPPGGYCFDPVSCGSNQKSFIDKNRTTQIAMVEDFLFAVRQQSDRTKGDHVMLTMGSDFQYQRAANNYANLDLLIGLITDLQKDDGIDVPAIFGPQYDAVNIFYSSPEYYTSCKYNETARHRTGNNAQVSSSAGENRIDAASSRRLIRNPRHAARPESSSSSSVEWSIKRDDFFPYSDCPNCFWTGYFTSRPALKRFERVASSFLLAARQIDSAVYRDPNEKQTFAAGETKPNREEFCEGPIFMLEDAVGLVQHHDAISGTSKQHVAYDYEKSMQAGIDAIVPCTIRKLRRILLGDEADALKDLTYCQLLNETKCGISVDVTTNKHGGEDSEKKDLYVVVYNSLASNRSTVIDLPVGSAGEYLVEDMQEGNAETLKAAQIPFRSTNHGADGESIVLSFVANSLPAVGAKVFRIQKHDNTIATMLNEGEVESSPNGGRDEFQERENGTMKISNGHFSVHVNVNSGDILRIGTQDVGKLSTWGYYTSFDSKKDAIHKDDDHNSGAYLFRPSTPTQKLQEVSSKNARIVHTSIGTEIHTEYEEPWIQTRTRIHKETPFLEIEYQIGPVPISDGRGREVVTRYNTMVDNDATFYTDSNGREFMKRRRNYRPTWDMTVFEPIAGNYYPINAAIYIDGKEETSNVSDSKNTKPAFAVVTDRTQGGGSIFDGTVELMVHRRLVADDHRGVGEPLNETDVGITPCPPYGHSTRIGEGLVIRGKHRILVPRTECKDKDRCEAVGGAQLARSVMDASFAEPLVFVASAPSSEEVPFRTKSYSGLRETLPKNVMLITKRLLYKEETTSYLVRLGHQYGDSVDVDLAVLFPHQSIKSIREMTLSANRDIGDWENERFDWVPSDTRRREQRESINTGSAHTITLAAMEIRTIIVEVE